MTPSCPIHGEMELCKITQGEGKDEIVLGYIWFCKEKECDECQDYDSDHPLSTEGQKETA